VKIIKRILAVLTVVIITVPVIAISVSLLISSPNSGKEIAEKKGLKHRMAIAHRGASYYAPELTIPAFETARDYGADYLETDVQRTKDGVLINYHDDDLKRTTNVEEIFPGRENDPVGSFTYAELMKLDAGSWFNEAHPERARPGFAGLKIPRFEEYIDSALSDKNNCGILIELKKPEYYPGIEKQILDALRNKGWLDKKYKPVVKVEKITGDLPVQWGLSKQRVILQTFDYESLKILKSLAPEIGRNLLIDDKSIKQYKTFEKMIELAVENESEMGPWGYMAWPWFVRKVHKTDKYFFVWTIDTGLYFRLFTFFGVDGVITNRSDKFLEFLGRELSDTPENILKKYN
jgi:glycerophosphoryl diester phosphodiesterase